MLIVLSLFINLNINYKNKLETKINYKDYNNKICVIKNHILEKNNGVIANDSCLKIKQSTGNDS
ncbi:MAG: hypothetical protein WCY27_01970 [archaeon]